MKWRPKDDTCGVPGRGYIKAEDYNQQDEDNLKARAKNRGIDFHAFMIGAGFVPVKGPQLEIEMDDEPEPENPLVLVNDLKPEEKKPKRKRRTKAEIEAEK